MKRALDIGRSYCRSDHAMARGSDKGDTMGRSLDSLDTSRTMDVGGQPIAYFSLKAAE